MSSRCCLSLVCLLIGIADGARAAERPPNIVYIMSDELAYYELSHMGNQRLRTPNIDQMAREGIRFTQALAAAP
ncbi:sulfatase-like hydrolase/transferase, partial [Stieleria sp.]|uniref:sulfatase-like hydrolase/transferase n=1 Tax=Stieleria sp. TaxID=2795976 RepID=UPI003568FAE2